MLLLWVGPLKYARGLGKGVQVQGGQANGADQYYDEAGAEVSLNMAIQKCISQSIDISSVQSCLVSVTRPGRALCVWLMLGTGSMLFQ